MLQYILQPTDTMLADLKAQIKAQPQLFLVASSRTTPEEWTKRQFAIFVDEQKMLPAFLTQDSAIGFAVNQHCMVSGKPLVTKASQSNFSRLIAEYAESRLLTSVIVYSQVPIGIQFAPSEFPYNKQPNSDTVMTEEVTSKQLRGVEEVKRALDTYETNARKKLDPGARYEHFATLVQSLVQQNNIDPNELDKALELPKGYTRKLFTEIHTATPAQAVVEKYLSYFGLAEYLYLYAKNCPEIRTFLMNHQQIDVKKLKAPPALTAERFMLKKIIRGTANGYYVYRLKIASKEHSEEIIVSNPLNLQVGREYQLVKGNGDAREEDLAPHKASSKIAEPSVPEMLEWVKEAERKGRGASKEQSERTYEDKRKDAIIAYFKKKQRDMNFKSAEAKYKSLEVEEDILDEFYKYVEHQQTSSIEVHGYTAKRIMKESILQPYDAYLTLVRLRNDPKGTIQWLHNPQNQRLKGEGKNS